MEHDDCAALVQALEQTTSRPPANLAAVLQAHRGRPDQTPKNPGAVHVGSQQIGA